MNQGYKDHSSTLKTLKILFAIIAVSAGLSVAQEQSSVLIDEAKIRAVLKDSNTVVIIPISNFADRSVNAELSLAWLSVDEKESGSARQEIVLQPGQSDFEVPLPLVAPSIWTRLRYSLVPDTADARSFAPIHGIVSLPHIADYAFELKLAYAEEPHSGNPLSIFGQAVHPLTRAPVTDIE